MIAADLPIGLVGPDGPAHGDGPPVGRELELADLLAVTEARGRHQHGVADRRHALHRRSLLRSEPRVYSDFKPFWEFVSGPLHAGTWGPADLDNTFGPQVRYRKGCTAEQGENLAPCFGLQFFGRVDIDGRSGVMTVTLKDVDDNDLWSIDIVPQPQARPAMVAQHS